MRFTRSFSFRASMLTLGVVALAVPGLVACDPPLPVAAPAPPTDCTLDIAGRDCWATHTGVPGLTEAQITAGITELGTAPRTTDLVITQDGTVIDKLWTTGCISVYANDVTIKNSLIQTSRDCRGGDNTAGPAAINTGGAGGATGLLIQDSEVDAGNTTDSWDYTGIGAANYHLLRVNAHGGRHTLWAGYNVGVEDSYLHDSSTATVVGHTEVIDADSTSYFVLSHSYVSAAGASQQAVTGAVFMGGHWAAPHHAILSNNFLEGGVGADWVIDPGSSSVGFVGNHLSPNTWPVCYSVAAGYQENGNGNVMAGNVQSETGTAFNPNC